MKNLNKDAIVTPLFCMFGSVNLRKQVLLETKSTDILTKYDVQ